MPGDSHRVDKILEFAKTVEEADFQTHHPYSIFKTKKNIQKGVVIRLIKGLQDISYFEESIYWCHRISEKCNIEETYFILSCLLVCYSSIGNHKMVLKYGHETLDLLARNDVAIKNSAQRCKMTDFRPVNFISWI